MSSTFRGTDLFGDGPHRFSLEPLGVLAPLRLSIGVTAPGSAVIGPLEVAVVVRGRLVAPSEGDMDGRLELIRSFLTFPTTDGELVDHHGRSYADAAFVRFVPADRTDRGRAVSLAFEARFVQLVS